MSPSWGRLGVSRYFDDGVWVEVYEDADAGVSVVHVVPGWAVGSDDFACVFEAVLFDVFVGFDFSLDVADGLLGVVVFVVVVAPEGVVGWVCVGVFVASFPCVDVGLPFSSGFGVCLGDWEHEVSGGHRVFCESDVHCVYRWV